MGFIKEHGLVLNNGEIEIAEYNLDQMHEQGIQHLHAAIVLMRGDIRDRSLQVLSQLRKNNKKQFPGHWCFCAGGHCNEHDVEDVGIGMADLKAIQREGKEEIGIDIDYRDINNGGKIVITDANGQLHNATLLSVPRLQNSLHITENQNDIITRESPIFSVAYIALDQADRHISFDIQHEEVDDLAWKTIEEVKSGKITPWFRHYLDRFLKNR